MKQIRYGVFETNSSSTHSICIQKAPVTIGKRVYFDIGEFGWACDCVDIGDYLYTAILCREDHEETLQKLKDILDKYNITYSFKEPHFDDWYLEDGYVDHAGEAQEFVDAVLSDEDMLMRCLFGKDSCVYTGSDCCDNELDPCYSALDKTWDNGGDLVIDNPMHDTEHFDYFFKGN